MAVRGKQAIMAGTRSTTEREKRAVDGKRREREMERERDREREREQTEAQR